jgi:hypothetical protein
MDYGDLYGWRWRENKAKQTQFQDCPGESGGKKGMPGSCCQDYGKEQKLDSRLRGNDSVAQELIPIGIGLCLR